jgi:hypothetical protein
LIYCFIFFRIPLCEKNLREILWNFSGIIIPKALGSTFVVYAASAAASAATAAASAKLSGRAMTTRKGSDGGGGQRDLGKLRENDEDEEEVKRILDGTDH